MSAETQVYVNWGRLVADCGRPECSDARTVEPGQAAMVCVMGHQSALLWDDALPNVVAELSERGEERRRNWFPRGHPLATTTGQPHGQSLSELRDEHAAGIVGGA